MLVLPPMFPTIASRDYSSILVGNQPHKLMNSVKSIVELSENNSLVTYITGYPGSGKSHTLLHLQSLFKDDATKIVVIINANAFNTEDGDPLEQLSILKSIYSDPGFARRAPSVNVQLRPSKEIKSVDELTNTINAVLRAEVLTAANDTSHDSGLTSLVIGIDGLDEYVRPSGEKGLLDFETKNLMINVKFLLDTLLRTCIILSFTADIYEKVRHLIEDDRTFMRRFISPQDFDGDPIPFQEFSLEETRQLYYAYRNSWIERVRRMQVDISSVKDSLDWPISSEAIELAQDATNRRPGPLMILFQSAFELVQQDGKDWLRPSNRINIQDMAELIYLATERKEHGIDISSDLTYRKISILRKFRTEKTNGGAMPSSEDLASFIKGWLKIKKISTVSERSIQLSSGKLIILTLAAGKSQVRVGFVPFWDSTLKSQDIDELNAIISSNRAHRIMIFTSKPDFDWAYSGFDSVGDVISPHRRHLGNYTYVVNLPTDSAKKIKTFAKYLLTPDEYATLWAMDRLIYPIKGYRFSEMIGSFVVSAIGEIE